MPASYFSTSSKLKKAFLLTATLPVACSFFFAADIDSYYKIKKQKVNGKAEERLCRGYFGGVLGKLGVTGSLPMPAEDPLVDKCPDKPDGETGCDGQPERAVPPEAKE